MTIITDRLTEIDERCRKTTPGDWELWDLHADPDGARVKRIGGGYPFQGLFASKGEIRGPLADLDFISQAHADVPWLLEQITALQDESEILRTAAAEMLSFRDRQDAEAVLIFMRQLDARIDGLRRALPVENVPAPVREPAEVVWPK